MILGGGTLILYARMWSKGWRVLWQDPQFRTYLLAIGLFSSITVLWGLCFSEYAWTQIFSRGIFSTISVITTTGFNVEDYNEWGHFISTLFLFLCVVGGCTGSTSGGIKIFRFQVMFRLIVSQLKQLRRQYGVYMPVYKGAKLEGNVISSVFVFVFLYIGVIFTIALSLSFFDLDLMTSFTSAIATIGNIGGGIGNVMEPAESYVALENGPKLILMLGMILGRLELLTVLVLFVPGFWRD
jgi:trk system potassium uptake protein TrkH